MLMDMGFADLLGPFLTTLAGFALAFVLLAYVSRSHERQSASLAWLLAIVLVPMVGVPAYLIFAGRKLARRARSKCDLACVRRAPLSDLDGLGAEIESILRGYGMSAASDGNEVRLIGSPVDAYEELVRGIEDARRSIHIATFVLGNDRVGKAIVERLASRAREGVEVRLLVDALGSFGARFFVLPRLARSGGETGVFMRALPVHRRWKANLRNHRKLAIFDGDTAIAGGMNLARQYIGMHPSREHWVDTTMHIRGPAVRDLTAIFADDWEFATGHPVPVPLAEPARDPGGQILQVIPSGPDVPHDALYDVLVASVYRARRRVWIVTPYFVPDAGLTRALLMQARNGCDVRIFIPRRSDNLVVDMARQRYVRQLRAGGVRFFAHPQRMIHAKHVLVDDTFAVAGSTNFDMRSLYLNYELALFCYDPRSVAAQEAWVEALLAECEPYEPGESGTVRRFAEDLCWLAGPLL